VEAEKGISQITLQQTLQTAKSRENDINGNVFRLESLKRRGLCAGRIKAKSWPQEEDLGGEARNFEKLWARASWPPLWLECKHARNLCWLGRVSLNCGETSEAAEKVEYIGRG
jgi:hypothetical protein